MKYYIDLFSPETARAFRESDQTVSGFRIRQEKQANRIKPGDRFLCYMTRLSRFFSVLEVVEGPFIDDSPLFMPQEDPFVVRFKVKVICLHDVEHSVPIHDSALWDRLSFTSELERSNTAWTGKVRSSLTEIDPSDGKIIESVLIDQSSEYPLTDADLKKLKVHRVRTHNEREVEVDIPEEDDSVPIERESIEIQAILSEIGEKMGYRIWLPKSDRSRVETYWTPEPGSLVESLPMNYDETTLSTIEQIDTIWISGRSIVRLFEVEHTTSIYSGILRMADLMALQPNLDIKAHIIAPESRRAKVLKEIRRPVFSLLEKGPLYNYCTYISYESIRSLHGQELLTYMKDTVLDEYAESSED